MLSMADGVLLLVDAAEGPMPQTRFVLSARPSRTASSRSSSSTRSTSRTRAAKRSSTRCFDLFIDLDATRTRSSSRCSTARAATAGCRASRTEERTTCGRCSTTILDAHPGADRRPDGPLQFRVTTLEWSDYVGRIAHRARAPRYASGSRQPGSAGSTATATTSKQPFRVTRHLHLQRPRAHRESRPSRPATYAASTASTSSTSAESLTDPSTRSNRCETIAIDEPTMSDPAP